MRFILLVLSICMAGCSAYEPTLDVSVKVQRNKENGTWLVSYESDNGFQTIDFERQRYKLRGRNWRILTEGVRIEDVGASERVIADKPIKKFEAEFDGRQPGVANDYPIVSHYSDGGVVLYTGHLFLKIPECDGCKVKHNFEFIAAEGENVITEENEGQDGDFVYFGDGVVTEYDSFRAIADREMPDWIQRQVERSLPNFLNHYQERLKFSLPRKPLVFLAFDKKIAVTEESYLGGVVGSHMQLVLVGTNWEVADGERYEKFAHLVAHEVFHFWNGALFLAPDRIGGSWLHEGGADAIADYALYELGYYGSDRYSAIQTERLNRCMLGLTAKSLPNSDERGYYRNFYECGAVMNHLVARKFVDGISLFDFWRTIFEKANNSFYSHEKFFKSIEPMVTDPTVITALNSLTEGRTINPSSFFKSTFDQLGISYSIAGSGFPGWYQQLASRTLVALIVERDCGAGVPVGVSAYGIYVQGTDRCSTLKGGHELQSVNGYPIPSTGAEAHDSLFARCSNDPVVTTQDSSGQSFVTSCHDFPQRPEYLRW